MFINIHDSFFHNSALGKEKEVKERLPTQIPHSGGFSLHHDLKVHFTTGFGRIVR